ncbi:L-serine ammonia-lyase [Roseibacillus persicicus]|uniref:L-serine ammonia-lyase n=1 Tax=Roseibacillus persicicus TaxID=454148 RepID=UPI00280C59DA|nr:L-serine ammonia-lyase [Roseibacillus persicicus]MDQ8190472.1 L-serine ammonia-lyase [Roseibacillus persicicus]
MHPESVLNFFTIGIGPSSSHTVGPMKAARDFVESLPGEHEGARLRCELFGSLAATGRGHHTDQAIVLGFLGHTPVDVPVAEIPALLAAVEESQRVTLPSGKRVHFDPRSDLVFHRGKSLPLHPNGMHFVLLDQDDLPVHESVTYSLGGGFIASEEQLKGQHQSEKTAIPYPYRNAAELLDLCAQHELSIAQLTLANEASFREEAETRHYLDQVWQAMQESIRMGCESTGTLPGGLKVKRRAPALFARLEASTEPHDPLQVLDWVNLFALAVNEENAGGGRIVTAPTNGAAGIIPAVLQYAIRFKSSPHDHPVHVFLLTAAAIANLYKTNASLSGADVGCQGEVGVACSMAAGALAAFLGGTPAQVENAAEIGMEHNLGLTCDPIGGLVQIPCIERNAMASVKAINAARLALCSTENHHISLDKVIATMLQTGHDMMAKYKETSRGGLAVNYTEC